MYVNSVEDLDRIGQEMAIIETEYGTLMNYILVRNPVVYGTISSVASAVELGIVLPLNNGETWDMYQENLSGLQEILEGYKTIPDPEFETFTPLITDARIRAILRWTLLRIPLSAIATCFLYNDEGKTILVEELTEYFKANDAFLNQWSSIRMTTAERNDKWQKALNGEELPLV